MPDEETEVLEPDIEEAEPEAAEAEGGEQQQEAEPASLSDTEQLATELGWAPKDDWRGDPDKWVDAKSFLRGTVDAHKALKVTVRNQDEKLANIGKTMERMAKVQTRVEQTAYERAVSDLKAQRRQAIEESDADTVEAIDEQIAGLAKPDTEPAEKTADGADPDFDDWHAENPWYGPDGDPRLTLAAEEAAKVIGRKYKGRELYDRVTKQMKQDFPEKFGNAARKQPNRVEGAGNGTMRRGSGEKTFNDLPAEAKAACDQFVKDGTFKTRADYVKEYFADE